VNVYGCEVADYSANQAETDRQLDQFVSQLERYKSSSGLVPEDVVDEIQERMTASGGHIRELKDARQALSEALKLYRDISAPGGRGFHVKDAKGITRAIRAEHLALTSVAYLAAIVELLGQGSGSRGSHLVLAEDGIQIHPDIINKATGKPLRFKPENESLRSSILRVEYDESLPDLFGCQNIELRRAPSDRKAFEPAWQDYREARIYSS
jgi:hypothetical protein